MTVPHLNLIRRWAFVLLRNVLFDLSQLMVQFNRRKRWEVSYPQGTAWFPVVFMELLK